jgi:hypothetical protein
MIRSPTGRPAVPFMPLMVMALGASASDTVADGAPQVVASG